MKYLSFLLPIFIYLLGVFFSVEHHPYKERPVYGNKKETGIGLYGKIYSSEVERVDKIQSHYTVKWNPLQWPIEGKVAFAVFGVIAFVVAGAIVTPEEITKPEAQ